MSYRWMAKWSCGRSVKAGRRLREAVCQSLEARRLLANTIYLDATSPGPTRDGTSWGNAYADLQLALGAAVSGDTIRVAEGTYRPTSDTDRTISFQLKTGVGIYGGYAGLGAGNPDARDVGVYSSILSGDIGMAGDNSDNSYHVVVGSGTDSTAILDGVTISDGNANGNGNGVPSFNGGGMYNTSGSPTLTDCTFSGNSAGYSGGGIYNGPSSSPTLTHCVFSGNVAGSGGGMENDPSASPKLINCDFSGNRADDGGGMYNYAASPTLTHCTFSGNTGGHGGGIEDYLATLTLTDCMFNGNSAGSGGGMDNGDSTATLINCVFTGNSATSGGGMSNSTSNSTLTNCTFSGNSASTAGGVVADTSTTLTNCIFWGNSPGNGQVYGLATVTYCDIEQTGGVYLGTGNINADPLFVRNPDAGPDGKWGTADDDYGDLRLLAFSPAADAGNSDASGLNGITTDASGGNRFLDVPTSTDTGVGTAPIVDMGAHETVPALAANAGGPYVGVQGHDFALSGLGASAVAGTLTYAWEWTGDGKFDDGAGPNPVFPTSNQPLSTPITVSLRVTDSALHSVITTSTVRILPSVIYVDASTVGGNGNGLSWANALRSLQTALSQAVAGSGQEIHVAGGTYTPTSTTDRTISFQLKNGVGILGGYAGASNPNARDVTLYPTILSGNIRTDIAGSYHVVVGSGTDSTAVLDGFTVSGGNANGDSYVGGGVYIASGSPTVRNCIFSGNSATFSFSSSSGCGAGMYLSLASPTLTDCTFTGNSAVYGGGIYNYDSSPTLTNCAFNGNSVSGPYALGGGMYIINISSPILINCTFTGNSVAQASGSGTGGKGGGIYNASSSTTLTNCTFSGNSASDYGGGMSGGGTLTNCTFIENTASHGGGGMYGGGTLTNCTFRRNSADFGGGMYNDNSASPTLTNCTFNGNTAGSGGGMYNSSAAPTLTNCTFSGNTAGSGGGMLNSASSPTLTNCTFAGNSGNSQGSALDDYWYSSPKLTNCILWDSPPAGAPEIYKTGDTNSTTTTDSDIHGGWTGQGNINADPLFAHNPSAGPDGQWGTADDDYGNLRLQTGSPCINTGSNAAVPAGITTDLAGNPRIIDGVVDLGAYEGANAADPNSNHAPTVSNASKHVNPNAPLVFTSLDFTGAFTDPDSGDAMQTAQITTLPGHGTLKLNNVAVTQGQEIAAGQLDALTYTPARDYMGCDSFGWNGSDGMLYASNAATVTLSISSVNMDWTRYYGGSKNEGVMPNAIAVDAEGNKLIGGNTTSTDLPMANNDYHAGAIEQSFVAKFDPQGTLLWSTYLGGSNTDEGLGIAVDSSGDTFITGTTDSSDFTGAINTSHGGSEAFLAKVSPGGATLWAIYLGGSGSEWGRAVNVDSAGNAYVTGFTESSNFSGASGTYTGTRDGFVAKVNASGTLQWATYLGGSGQDRIGTIAVNGNGETVVAGVTTSTNLPHATNTYHGGASDAFVAKLGLLGAVQWVTYLGGSDADWEDGNDLTAAVALDSQGNALVSGYTISTDLALANNTIHGGYDAFLYKVNSTGTSIWATYLGGTGEDRGVSVAVDSADHALVTGGTASTAFSGATNVSHGNIDGFLADVSPGGAQSWAMYVGGSDRDWTASVAFDAAGHAWLIGGTRSSDLPGANNTSPGGETIPGEPNALHDVFISRAVYDHAPSGIGLSVNTVAEYQSSGTTIGTLSTTDPDAGDTFTYTLVGGTGGTDNSSFTISGNSLKSNPVFNYAAKHSYSIRVRSTDQGGLWFEKNLTIVVTAVQRSTIKGTIFNDLNADTIRGKGEGILAGQKVFLDTNNNGKFDAGEASLTTSSQGAYTFANLLPGLYHFHALPGKGWRVSKGAAGYDLSVVAGQILTGKDFGQTQMALVSGSVFNDANGNKLREVSEAGLAGWTVFMDKNNNGKPDKGELFATTNATGVFSLNLAAGTYTLRVVAKTGYKCTTPVGGKLVVKPLAGQSLAGVFGFKK